MNQYYFYLQGSVVGYIESKEQLGGNDIMKLKIFFGDLHNASYTMIEVKQP